MKKKSLSIMTNEHGFATILTLLILSGLLLSLSTSFKIYETEKNFSKLEYIQLTHQSLHQMTYQTLKNDAEHKTHQVGDRGTYTFPNGTTSYLITTGDTSTLLYIESMTSTDYMVRKYYPFSITH